MNAAAASSSIADQSGIFTTPVPTSSPTVKSRVSPGRKNPSSRPVSAKMIAAPTQGATVPKVARCCGSSQDGPRAGRAEVTASTLRAPAYRGRVSESDPGDEDVGVGPWSGPWPGDPRFDPELLQHGDRRNVADRYRYWTVEAIVADLDARRHPFHVAIENFGHDLNIGTVVRTANAFLAAEVHIVGRRRWNRRG